VKWRDYQRLQRLVQVGDAFLSYVDEGHGMPVVLLHGMPAWGWLWHDLVGRLAPHFRVLVPDLIGFGFSDKRDGLDRSVPAQTAAVAQWLERLEITGAIVIGHDLGAWPAAGYVQLGRPEVARDKPAAFMRALRGVLRVGFAHHPDGATLDALTAPYGTDTGQRSLVRDAAALDTNQTMLLVPHLPHLRQPTMVLWGDEDEIAAPEYAELLSLDLPRGHVEKLPGVGHYPMLESPELFAARLGELLRSPVGLDLDLRLPPFIT
jgi:pimeloyl-ACP methyl ester carboxylesterase